MTSRFGVRRVIAVVFTVATVASIGLWSTPTSAANGTVQGTVTLADGTTPVSNASISIHDTYWTVSQYATTGSDGTFSFSLSAGEYRLEVYSSEPSYFNPDPQTLTVTDNAVTDLGTVELVAPNVFGKITEPDGTTPVANASVNIHSADWTIYRYDTTDVNGDWSIGLSSSGTYAVEVYANHPSYSNPEAVTFAFTAGSNSYFDGTNGSNVMRLRAPALRGIIVDGNGNPLEFASVTLHDTYWTWQNSRYASTDATGTFTLGAVASGTYLLEVSPPYIYTGTQYVRPDPIAVTLTSGTTDTTYVTAPIVIGQAMKTISGRVYRSSNGEGVANASISAYVPSGYGYANATTDESGNYELTVGTGTWSVSVYPMWTNGTAPDWSYTDVSQQVQFTQNNTVAESSTLDFAVSSHNSIITGTVRYPDGSVPPQSDYISVSGWSGFGGGGNWTQIDSSGDFTLRVPAGTFNIDIWGSNYTYEAPAVDSVTVGENETADLGTITFLERDATIQGTVRDTNGNGLNNQYVSCWKRSGGHGWGSMMTGSDGTYSVPVTAGQWMCSAYPSWNWSDSTTYVSTEEPAVINVSEDEDETGNDFTFAIADATIQGTIQDADANVLPVWGWVDARRADAQTRDSGYWYSGLGASASNGTFRLKVPAGDWTLNANFGYGQYTTVAPETITIASGETLDDIVIQALPNNSTIQGSFVDSDGNAITSLYGSVFADNGSGGHQWAAITGGTYSLRVAAGTWTIGKYVDPWQTSQYFDQPLADNQVTIGAEETVTRDIVLLAADSTISGTVLYPDGSPAPNVLVEATTSLGSRQSTSFDMYGAWFRRPNETDANGQFSLNVAAGSYYVSAKLPPSLGYVNPEAVLVSTSSASPAADIVLQFQDTDATITGSVAVVTTAEDADTGIHVWGRNSNGGYAETWADTDGSYALDVTTSSEPWYVGAAEDNDTIYYRTETDTPLLINAPGTYTLDLSLTEQSETLGAATNATFDAGSTKTITVPGDEDATITIPPYTLDAQGGNYTVTVTQTGEGSVDPNAEPASIGYDIEAFDDNGVGVTTLTSDMTVCVPYNDDVDPADLSASYWDESIGAYQPAYNLVVNETDGQACFTTDHLTTFSLTVPPSVTDTVEDVPENPGNQAPETDQPDAQLGSAHNIVVAPVNGGPQIRVFDEAGQLQASFFAYGASLRGTFNVATADVDGDGSDEIITSTGDGFPVHIRVFEPDGTLLGHFFPFDTGYRRSASLVLGDVTGDGAADIVVSPLNGTANVRVYQYAASTESFDLIDWALAYDAGFRGGTSLRLADVNGDGRSEIVTAPRGGAPNVRVYTYNITNGTIDLLGWFWGLDEGFRGTVGLRAGDLTGDGKDNIVVWPTGAAAPNVRVYKYNSQTMAFELVSWFWAYDDTGRVPFDIQLGDVTGDGRKDIVTAPRSGGGPNVRVYSYTSGTQTFDLVDWFMAYDDGYTGGVKLTLGDTDGDGMTEIVTTPNAGGPNVRVYQYNPDDQAMELVDWTFGLNEGYRGGLSVHLTDLTGDGDNEILVAPRGNGGPNVRLFENAGGSIDLLDWFWAYGQSFTGGVQLNSIKL